MSKEKNYTNNNMEKKELNFMKVNNPFYEKGSN